MAKVQTEKNRVIWYKGVMRTISAHIILPVIILVFITILTSSICIGCSEKEYVDRELQTNGPVSREWENTYDQKRKSSSYAITLDSSGNVYVTGNSTVKYNSDGKRLWKTGFDGTTGSEIALDASGNVYVAGRNNSNNCEDEYTIVKYNSDGKKQWVQYYNNYGDKSTCTSCSRHLVKAMVVDKSGNVYITGTSMGNDTYLDYATVMYDTNGNQLWVSRYDGPQYGPAGLDSNAADEDKACDIAVDSWGNVYVTGSSYNADKYADYTTIKYDSQGNELWVRQYLTPDIDDSGSGIAIDYAGHIYVTGSSGTVKYDSDGNEIWISHIGGNDLFLDKADNLYILGSTVHKYDHDRNHLWTAQFPDNSWVCDTPIYKMAVDTFGNVYAVGEGPTIIAIDNKGLIQWQVTHNNGTCAGAYRDVGIDSLGNVYVTGCFIEYIEEVPSLLGYDTSMRYIHVSTTSKYSHQEGEKWVDPDGKIDARDLTSTQEPVATPKSTLTSNINTIPSGDVVHFPDPMLEHSVRKKLERGRGEIYKSDIEEIEMISTSASLAVGCAPRLRDLTGIELFHNLTFISFSGQEVSDLSLLSTLPKLSVIELFKNNVSDLSPLSDLTLLRRLNLYGNQISDLSPLSNLTSLDWVNLENNLITDIYPLVENRGIGQRNYVNLIGNPLSDQSINEYIPALQARGVHVIWGE